MKSLFFRFTLLIGLYSCSTHEISNTKNERVPAQAIIDEKLNNEDKVKILLAIHKEVPELFTDSARYEIDLFKLLDDQAQLQRRLSLYPDFLQRWNERKYLEIKIKVKESAGKTLKSKVIKESAVQDWIGSLKKISSKILKEKKDLNNEAISITKVMENRTSAGFLNGLILNLPKKLWAEARELQKSNNLLRLEAYLDENLPDQLLNFKSTPMETNLSKSALVKKWKEILTFESDAGGILDLAIIANNRNHSLNEMIAVIDELDAHDLESLGDKDYQKIALEKIFKKENIKLPTFYDRHLKFYHSQVTTVTSTVESGDKIFIREQNPNVAIFRGCTGGDCASQFSFPYPNDPNERVFFIYDKDRHLKGYVCATMLTDSDGVKSLYVITIAGNRVNSEDADLIIQSLYKEKAALGIKQILLPAKENIQGLINFPLVRSVYERIANDGQRVDLNYDGQEIRQEIQKFKSYFNRGKYDFMERNAVGVKYVPIKDDKLILETAVSSFSDKKNLLDKGAKIDPAALFDFLCALKFSGHDNFLFQELFEEIKTIHMISDDEGLLFKKMFSVIDYKRIKTGDIDQIINEFSERFGVGEEKIRSMKKNLFFNAYLLATDAFDNENYDNNIKRLLEDLKFNAKTPLVKRSRAVYYGRWRKELQSRPEFQAIAKPYIEQFKNNKSNFRHIFLKDVERYLLVAHNNEIALPAIELRGVLDDSNYNKDFVAPLIKACIEENEINMIDFADKFLMFNPSEPLWLMNQLEISLQHFFTGKGGNGEKVGSEFLSAYISALSHYLILAPDKGKENVERLINLGIHHNRAEVMYYVINLFEKYYSDEWSGLLDNSIKYLIKSDKKALLVRYMDTVLAMPNVKNRVFLIETISNFFIQSGHKVNYFDESASAINALISIGKLNQEYSLKFLDLIEGLEPLDSSSWDSSFKNPLHILATHIEKSSEKEWTKVHDRLINVAIKNKNMAALRVIHEKNLSASPSYLREIIAIFDKNKNWDEINGKIAEYQNKNKGRKLSCDELVRKFFP